MARFGVEGDEDGNGEGPRNNDRYSRKRLCASQPTAVAPKRASASTSNSVASASTSASARKPFSTSADRQIPPVRNGGLALDPMEEESDEEFLDEESEQEFDSEEENVEEEEGEEEEEEEEEHEEMVQAIEARANSTCNGNDKSTESVDVLVPLSVTLTDPDVLDCPICLEPLNPPIYQCENGHIACSPCCTKTRNKCPSCCMPIGYNRCRAIERVIDSVRISCCYKPYGCQEYLPYDKKLQHEKVCYHKPCSCPHPGCTISGLSQTIYAHFSAQHRGSVQPFSFNTACSVKLGPFRKYMFLQEKNHATLFVLNRCIEDRGSLVSIVCAAQASSERKFDYKVSASDDGSSNITLSSVAEKVARWIEGSLGKKYVLIPMDFVNSKEELVLEITIWKRANWVCF